MLNCCLVNGWYSSVINTGIFVHLHHPAGGPIAGEVAVVVALANTPMGPVSIPGMGGFLSFFFLEQNEIISRHVYPILFRELKLMFHF